MFQITIDNLKLIILKKDEATQNFLTEINKYNCIIVQTFQSPVQDSVKNNKTHGETQGQVKHESREPSGPGFAAPDPATGPEAPLEEILHIPIWLPFENKPINECIANIRCDGNCIHTAFSQTQPQNLSEPKVICYDYKEEFITKN